MMTVRLLILSLLLVACSPRPEEQRLGNGVLLITVDGWRQDHLGAFGAPFATTPWLSAEAPDAIFFTNAWAHDGDPVVSHASILSGSESMFCLVPEIALDDGTVIKPVYTTAMPDRLPRLARRFLAGGWATAAFLDNPRLSSLRGLTTGFHDVIPLDGSLSMEGESDAHGIEPTHERLVRWLDQLPADRNWFAWVHVADLTRIFDDKDLPMDEAFLRGPDDAWTPPTGIRWPSFHSVATQNQSDPARTLGQGLAVYDTALARLDTGLGAMIQDVRSRMDPEETTIALAGSTGLSFGEAGGYFSSTGLSSHDLAVPLVLWPRKASGIDVGRTMDGLVGLADLGPTLLEIHGSDPPGPDGMTGLSLASHLRNPGRPAPRAGPEQRDNISPWDQLHGGFGGQVPVLLTSSLMGGHGFVSDTMFFMDAGSKPALLRALTGIPGRPPNAAAWVFVEERASGRTWRAARSDITELPEGMPGRFDDHFGPESPVGSLLEQRRTRLHGLETLSSGRLEGPVIQEP